MHHPNVVKYYDHFIKVNEELIIIIEYCRKGDLYNHLIQMRK